MRIFKKTALRVLSTPFVAAVSLISLAALASASTGDPYRFDLPQTPDEFFYTLNQSLAVNSPVLTTTNGAEYITDVFRLILISADKQASNYITQNGDERAYWAFMVAALAVPFHEGRYQQFRELPQLDSLCEPLNSGSGLKNMNSTLGRLAYSSFEKDLHGGSNPSVPDCSNLDSKKSAIQLMGSEDLLSTGMMQLSLAYHDSDYFAPRKYLSLQDTIDYGLSFYKTSYNGFDQIYRSASKYPCLTQGLSSGEKMNYKNLIRAAWGVYNGGPSTADICRFESSDQNDADFLQNLGYILSPASSDNPFKKTLQGQDLLAYQEIIDNFLNGANSRVNVDKVIQQGPQAAAQPQVQAQAQPLPQAKPEILVAAAPAPEPAPAPSPTAIPAQAPSASSVGVVNVEMVNVRTTPSLEDGKLCGDLPLGTEVEVLSKTGDWSKVQVSSADANLVENCGSEKYIVSAAITAGAAAIQASISVSATYVLAPAPGKNPAMKGTVVNASFVDVHKEIPYGSVVGVVKGGQSVTIVAEKMNSSNSTYPWYQISPSGGWVYGSYIRVGK